jgi:hypothetical protein
MAVTAMTAVWELSALVGRAKVVAARHQLREATVVA